MNNLNNNFKEETERLTDQKRKLEKDITHLEQIISDLQLNLTNTQQQLKKEVSLKELNLKCGKQFLFLCLYS